MSARDVAPAGGQPPPLLVVNRHAGANRLGKVNAGQIVALLPRMLAGVQAEVCDEPEPALARRRVRAAVRDGCPLVIAAGGDGTVEAVAAELVNSQTALGIIPLGTYNNLAVCLDIPTNLEAACALLATGEARAIDVGEVRARGLRRPRIFVEQATVGLGALLAPFGESFEKGHWLEALRTLPAAVRLEPVPVRISVDRAPVGWHAETLLVTICNASRSAAAFLLAPEARMDDGQLDLCVYDGLRQAQLAAKLFDFLSGGLKDQPGLRRSRISSVEITSSQRLLVAADSDVVGETPARFIVRPGALRVIAGSAA